MDSLILVLLLIITLAMIFIVSFVVVAYFASKDRKEADNITKHVVIRVYAKGRKSLLFDRTEMYFLVYDCTGAVPEQFPYVHLYTPASYVRVSEDVYSLATADNVYNTTFVLSPCGTWELQGLEEITPGS